MNIINTFVYFIHMLLGFILLPFDLILYYFNPIRKGGVNRHVNGSPKSIWSTDYSPYQRNDMHYFHPLKEQRSRCHKLASGSCGIPPQTSEGCYNKEYQNCNYEMRQRANDPYKFTQCTNNNLTPPNNLPCECGNRSHDTCPSKNRINESCYTKVYDQCRKGR